MTAPARPDAGQRVAVVTGGGGGIGAAIAEQLGREGVFVVTLDPLVSLDGSEVLPAPEETTAGRIVAAGGSARACPASVTDRDAVRELFAELGRLDAVVNVAGITRPTSFTRGQEVDWRTVLEVHLDGYLTVLQEALPIMAAAGHGHILGVTSGSGWRSADTGAYGCAKRAVASLTWHLGRLAPPGVVINAVSPIAVTRMVTAALRRSQAAPKQPSARSGSSSTGGLSLGSMPAPEELGPLGAHLVSADFATCRGQVIFTGGSEVAVVDAPRLLEAVRTDGGTDLARVLDAVTPGALVPAEASQASGGGSNPRFGQVFTGSGDVDLPAAAIGSCVVFTDRADVGAAVAAALGSRAVTAVVVPVDAGLGFGGAAEALAAAAPGAGAPDAVVVALAGPVASVGGDGWARALAEHEGIVAGIHADAGWARAVADRSAQTGRPVRLVTLTDAATAGGRSRAQASAQLARAARTATEDRVTAFAVSVEATAGTVQQSVGELVAHLLCDPRTPDLSGAELVAGDGWIGLRSHPHPGGSMTLGGSQIPAWFDVTLGAIVGEEAR